MNGNQRRGAVPNPAQRAAVTFLLGACWVALALLAVRTMQRIVPVWSSDLPGALLTAAFVFLGLLLIGRRWVSDARPLSSIGLVERPGMWREVALGLAIGWAVAVALLLPALLTYNLHSTFTVNAAHLRATLFGLALLLCSALVNQLIFTGLLFRSLVRATSPTIAVLLFSMLTAWLAAAAHRVDGAQALFVGLAQLLFSLGALRTRAIWLPFGLQCGWGVSLLLLFGVRSFYWPSVERLVSSSVAGPRWLTGTSFGPEASAWAFVVVLLAMVALWRATRDYAWHYTFDPIEGAGYPMDVAPPKAHAEMEAAAMKPATLVQIAPLPPATDRSGTCL